MPRAKRNQRTHLLWGAGLAVALAVHVAGLLLFSVDSKPGEAVKADYSFASLPSFQSTDAEMDLLLEQAFLSDSAPLFLPTRWNSAFAPVVRALEQRPPELFDLFPARFSYGEGDFGLRAIETEEPELNVALLDALGGTPYLPFGRESVGAPSLTRRFASLEVARPGEEVVLVEVLPEEDAPAGAGQFWRPAEFLVHVENVGVVGEPILLEGSGVEEIDQALREGIRSILRERMLDSGYFRVVAGP